MSDWWAISKQNQLKDFQRQTQNFIESIQLSIKNFEKNGDAKDMVSKLKSSISEFQKNID